MWVFGSFVFGASAWAGPLDPARVELVVDGAYDAGDAVIDTADGTDPPLFNGLEGAVQAGVAVFAFESLTIDRDVVVRGSRPLAILSRGELYIGGRIDLSATGNVGVLGGASSLQGDRGSGTGGGEAALSGAGAGHCGAGGASGDAEGGDAHGNLLTRLTGGSGGGTANGPGGGSGGGGGGAIEIGALGRLTLAGDVFANGASALDRNRYAGGGGSGGGVFLHGAQGSRCTGEIQVIGGQGGSSNNDLAGGGGGGGCVLTWGLDTSMCTIVATGGMAGVDDKGPDGTTSATPGQDAVPELVLDIDFDGDGYRLSDDDCNDLDAAIHPGADDIADGIDNNCDGVIDPDGPSEIDPMDTAMPIRPEPSDPTEPPEIRLPGYAVCSCDGLGAGGGGGLWGLAMIVAVRRRRS